MPADYQPKTCFEYQTDPRVTHAGAVQNTWYEVLNETRHGRVIGIVFGCTVIAETVEVEVTIGGVTATAQQIGAVAGNLYNVVMHGNSWTANNLSSVAGGNPIERLDLEGTGILIRIRKTTAAGASAIRARVLYELS